MPACTDVSGPEAADDLGLAKQLGHSEGMEGRSDFFQPSETGLCSLLYPELESSKDSPGLQTWWPWLRRWSFQRRMGRAGGTHAHEIKGPEFLGLIPGQAWRQVLWGLPSPDSG